MKQAHPILLTLFTLCLTTAAYSQPASRPSSAPPGPPPPGERAGMILQRVQELTGQLGLSDEQKTKIAGIVEKTKNQWQEMRQDLESMDPQERGQRIRDLMEGARKDISDVLNADQKAIFEKKWEEGRQNFRNRFGQGGQNGATTRPSFGAGATTRPGAGGIGGPGGPGRAGGAGGGAGFDRLRQNLEQLGLSDDQKTKIRDLFDEVKTKGQNLRMQAESGVDEARTQLRQLSQDTREKLSAILTTEQRDKLRDLMGAPPGPGGSAPPFARDRRPSDGEPGRPRPGQTSTTQKADAAGSDKMMMQDNDGNMMSMSGPPSSSSKSDNKKKDTVALTPTTPGLAVGQTLPPLSFKKLDGTPLELSSLKGHVIVLEFGSYSCPAFRNRVAAMEKLKTEYGTRASFFVVYSKEAHALGEWEVDRNKDEGISVEQPRSLEMRKTLADQARDKLKITVPILMDTIGNDAQGALGASANSAYLISRDGTILARQKWFEPIALRRVLDEATKPTAPPAPPARPAPPAPPAPPEAAKAAPRDATPPGT